MFQEQDFQAISEAIVYDPEGHKLGRVGRLYVDDETGQPSWVTVHTGMFGTAKLRSRRRRGLPCTTAGHFPTPKKLRSRTGPGSMATLT